MKFDFDNLSIEEIDKQYKEIQKKAVKYSKLKPRNFKKAQKIIIVASYLSETAEELSDARSRKEFKIQNEQFKRDLEDISKIYQQKFESHILKIFSFLNVLLKKKTIIFHQKTLVIYLLKIKIKII